MTRDTPSEQEAPFDPRPSIPGTYQAWRDPRDARASDRDAGAAVVEKVPALPDVIWHNWEFQKRAVGHIAQGGVRQYIDIGPGLPLDGEPRLVDIARRHQPEARWVAVDIDQVVLARWRHELRWNDKRLSVVAGDLRDPMSILDACADVLDLSERTAVVMGAVVHFLCDEDRPADILRTVRRALVSGSPLAITHATSDPLEGAAKVAMEDAAARYSDDVAPITLRSYDEVAALLDGWELLPPGLAKTVELLPPEDGPLIYVEDAPHAWAAVAVVPRE